MWSDLFWCALGIVGGAIVAVVIYFVTRSKKLLEYTITSTNLITNEMRGIPGLKITLEDEPITSLTSTTIKFTNRGNQSIQREDFASKSPLSIFASDHLMGSSNTCNVESQNPNANISVQFLADHTIAIDMEFLKPKESFSITCLHEGRICVNGELKSGKIVDRLSNAPIWGCIAMLVSNLAVVANSICIAFDSDFLNVFWRSLLFCVLITVNMVITIITIRTFSKYIIQLKSRE